MARSERAQWARLDIDGVAVLADLAAGTSLAQPVQFNAAERPPFGAPAAHSEPLVAGGIALAVDRGAACNCSILTFTPHAHGTHTEAAGHLTREPLDAYRVVPQRLLIAALVSVAPERAATTVEGSEPTPAPTDRLITRAALERGWPRALAPRLAARAVVIRTRLAASDAAPLPAAATDGRAGEPPPFLSREAAAELVSRGIAHLVLDVPSADRLQDGGALTAHRVFFGLPAGSSALGEAQRRDCTITELAHVDDALADGWYLLSLQTPALAGDAVPSRPVLYPLRLA